MQFDRDDMLRRARQRLARRSSVSAGDAETRHAIEYVAIGGLERVVEWARLKGLEIDFNTSVEIGRFHSGGNRIEVSTRYAPEKQLAVLLHEIGHYLIEASSKGGTHERYPSGYARIDTCNPKRDALHKIDVVAEEFEAWHRGLRLAIRLKIVFDREYFDTVRADYLKSYFKWALKRGRVSDD